MIPCGTRRGGEGVLALTLALVAFVPGRLPGLAAAPAKSAETLKSKKDALGDLRRQLDEAKARAAAARVREASLLSELERMDRDLVTKRVDLAQLDQRIGRLEGELGRLTGRRGRVAEETVAQQAALVAQLRGLARLRAVPSPPDWLAGPEEVTRARAAGDLGRVIELGAARLAEFSETAERIEQRETAVSRGRRALVDLRGRVDAERGAMNQQATERRKLLASVRDDRATHEKMAAELEDAARRLEALVRELSRRARARAAVARLPGEPRGPAVGLGLLRGQLPWPTEGKIVAGFGPQVHPRFGTETVRRGVDIGAPEGTPIRAVSAGAVLYRGWLKGYGNLVILDHGQGYYTLYAHASEVLTDEGDQVKTGQPIARVGETGSVEGPRLYFEVRYQGRAEDPQIWLRRRP